MRWAFQVQPTPWLCVEQGGARVWNFSSEGGQSAPACFLSAPGSVLTPPVLAGHLLHACVCVCKHMHAFVGVGCGGDSAPGNKASSGDLDLEVSVLFNPPSPPEPDDLEELHDYVLCVPVTRKVIRQGARETEKGRIAQLF